MIWSEIKILFPWLQIGWANLTFISECPKASNKWTFWSLSDSRLALIDLNRLTLRARVFLEVSFRSVKVMLYDDTLQKLCHQLQEGLWVLYLHQNCDVALASR